MASPWQHFVVKIKKILSQKASKYSPMERTRISNFYLQKLWFLISETTLPKTFASLYLFFVSKYVSLKNENNKYVYLLQNLFPLWSFIKLNIYISSDCTNYQALKWHISLKTFLCQLDTKNVENLSGNDTPLCQKACQMPFHVS
jgi:hypothetical protein